MIKRDSTYKSFFMVSFLLYLGFGLESFGNIDRKWIFVGLSPPFQMKDLMPDSHMSDEG
jgi:hypothetical protein